MPSKEEIAQEISIQKDKYSAIRSVAIENRKHNSTIISAADKILNNLDRTEKIISFLPPSQDTHFLSGSTAILLDALNASGTGMLISLIEQNKSLKVKADSMETASLTSDTLFSTSIALAELIDPIIPKKLFDVTTNYFDMRLDLATELDRINPEWMRMLSGVLDALQNKDNPDWFVHASHGLRLLMDDIFNRFAPDNEVKDAEWYIPADPPEKVSITQKIKFALLRNRPLISNKTLENIELRALESNRIYNEIVGRAKTKRQPQNMIEIEALIKTDLIFCQNLIKEIIKKESV